MNLLAAVDENWGLGQAGQLLCRISADLKQFREKTTGNVVILGRKTLLTFPNGKPLKDRINIVLTRDTSFSIPGAIPCFCVSEAIAKAQAYQEKEIYVIGGESIYEQFLPYCNTAYLTKIKRKFVKCDAFLKNLDEEKDWKLLEEGQKEWEKDISFSFSVYQRVKRAEN